MVGVTPQRQRRRGIPVPRILVADDNSNIQKMVVLAFQERGIEVTSVGNGEAAVRRLPDLNPDLVLADVFMPVRNGYEVCEFVKKDQRFAHIPVILLVGAFDPLDEKEARRVGADGVLKKPFVPPDPLIAMVMSALEKNPKLAAEVAKAKKAESEPVAAVPFELPSVPEPKPLPRISRSKSRKKKQQSTDSEIARARWTMRSCPRDRRPRKRSMPKQMKTKPPARPRIRYGAAPQWNSRYPPRMQPDPRFLPMSTWILRCFRPSGMCLRGMFECGT